MEENLKVIWEQRYNDWKESGLSKSQWCEKKKLNIHQLYYWFRRLSKNHDKQLQEKK